MNQRFDACTLVNQRCHWFASLFEHTLTLFATLTILLLLGMPILSWFATDFFVIAFVVSLLFSGSLFTLETILRYWSPDTLGVRRFILHEHGLTRLPGRIEYGREECRIVVQLDPYGDYADDTPTPLYHVQMVARKRVYFEVWLTEPDVTLVMTWATACQVPVDDQRERRACQRPTGARHR